MITVMDIEEPGGDWMREGAKQITGFGFGGAFGVGIGQAVFTGGMSAVYAAGLTIAGPIGWTVLAAVFTVSLTAGYFAGGIGDTFGQNISSRIMDNQ